MNLWLRLLVVTLRAVFDRRVGVTSPSRLRLRVWLTDLDLNIHMTNARYLAMLDLGKIDLMIRTGVAALAYRNKWRPLIGGGVIRYRFGLRPFEGFQIFTRVLCWDEKWTYFEHRIESKRGTSAIALGKALLRDADRSVPFGEVLAALGQELRSPPLPDQVAQWVSLEGMLRSDDDPAQAGSNASRGP